MKSVTIKIKIPRELRDILKEHYTDKDLAREIREECEEFLWDIYHALKGEKNKRQKIVKDKVA